MTDDHVGLRELKKLMTRDAISAAALKLTEEKGLNEVTIDDIAREAFVSPRTVSNYFASKEEAVLAAGKADAARILDDFSASTSQDPPLKILCELLSTYARDHADQLRGAARMADLEHKNPSLRPYRVSQEVQLLEKLCFLVAARTGTDATTDLYPSLVASAAFSAMLTSLEIWWRNDLPDERLPQLIMDAFNLVSAGYPHETGHPDPAATVSAPA
ncbi:TetR/AcrR family transcriptional regulator [Nesterenkonia sp. Act20]|uniref:TetR/AcrR family transcriptional regulator n=1 Tax=Nesterenkonia sp. Act20 TaxID=1483432 RepID=UPI001C496836|nr:TetR/AcrR family transcriptional regulator [Nesterenkonia sp. Act20]